MLSLRSSIETDIEQFSDRNIIGSLFKELTVINLIAN